LVAEPPAYSVAVYHFRELENEVRIFRNSMINF
jgi:hypothetical protein